MPRGDGTGPMGMGPMSGRGVGYCAGFAAPGYAHPFAGRGGGCGRGWRHQFYATGLPGWTRGYPVPYQTSDPNMESQALQRQADALQAQLELLQKRMNDLKAKTAEE